ncbi:GNAT family N-acetyltransferase [Actinomadura luzonensis]|uniref:GNAT family N-acetyltransferase n=1 Tax=Actinomadura luzonensis TaxID=2805427 RepID=UPI00267625FA|nr:GNAT family N-acetyltransferase [Actinomadura luzonensis]
MNARPVNARPGPAVRAAGDADMPAVRRIAHRFGLLGGWPGGSDFLDAERAFGELLVATEGGAAEGEGAEGEGAVGFGGTLRRGGLTHLGDLFVLPEHQSGGVGRALLAGLLAAPGPKVTFASSDARAVALYVRHGLRPWTPLLYLSGPLAPLPGGAVRPASAREVAGEVAGADARASGGARPATLAWYAAQPGVSAHVTPGGSYAFARRAGEDVVIGPAGGDTPHGCARAVLGALAAAWQTARETARQTGGQVTGAIGKVAVPGTSPLVPALLEAGWRITDTDTLMAGDDALVRPDRYAPHPDLG